jgi:DNA-3-methyladenine glycosylase
MSPLPRHFYLHPTLHVAKALLGKVIVHRTESGFLSGRIVETEAYLGSNDPASHAYRGKTGRNSVMFSLGGTLYVYFTYGMHFCANVVTGDEGKAGAVLIRGVEPIEGIDLMRQNRGFADDSKDRQLTNGPAKFCQAFGIARDQNGVDLCGKLIFIADAPTLEPKHVGTSSRIGITTGREKPWRFFIKGNGYVSK